MFLYYIGYFLHLGIFGIKDIFGWAIISGRKKVAAKHLNGLASECHRCHLHVTLVNIILKPSNPSQYQTLLM